MINIPSHHRSPTIKPKATHPKPEIICSPSAKINVGATLAVARLVCSPRYYRRVYYLPCTMQSICNVILGARMKSHLGTPSGTTHGDYVGQGSIPERELAIPERVARYGAAGIRRPSSRSQPCPQVCTPPASPLASLS